MMYLDAHTFENDEFVNKMSHVPPSTAIWPSKILSQKHTEKKKKGCLNRGINLDLPGTKKFRFGTPLSNARWVMRYWKGSCLNYQNLSLLNLGYSARCLTTESLRGTTTNFAF
jgi:hypothetical protein